MDDFFPSLFLLLTRLLMLTDVQDPDYECLMLPGLLRDGRPDVLADLGFTYDTERGMYYHQGTEFGRRKADPEEVSLEKFTNYLDVSFLYI